MAHTIMDRATEIGREFANHVAVADGGRYGDSSGKVKEWLIILD